MKLEIIKCKYGLLYPKGIERRGQKTEHGTFISVAFTFAFSLKNEPTLF